MAESSDFSSLNPNDKTILAKVDYGFSGGRLNTQSINTTLADLTFREVTLAESLLTPGLQTSMKFHSSVHISGKDYDELKNSILDIIIDRPVLSAKDMPWNFNSSLAVQQRVYRLSNRKLFNNNVEELTIQACDDSLLNDARSLVSKTWACGTSPSKVVSDVLSNCLNVSRTDIEDCYNTRSYVAENIHPFQVINEQANVALYDGNDPSFVHYMTYDNLGTHHFRSLASLIRQNPVSSFQYSETGSASGYAIPTNIMTYSFPCDYDLLSDILNGIDVDGSFINSLVTFNPSNKILSLFGNKATECGIGGGNIIYPSTNLGSAENQETCNTGIEQYLLRRQARMNLLEQDKISLRLTVPWNPDLHVGKTIEIKLNNKPKTPTSDKNILNYGSGNYLIASLVHNIKAGGFATTTMDCISQSAAASGVI